MKKLIFRLHRNSLDFFSVISDRLIAEFLTDSPSFVFILVDLICVHASNYRLLAIYYVTFDYSITMISFMSQVKAACFQKGGLLDQNPNSRDMYIPLISFCSLRTISKLHIKYFETETAGNLILQFSETHLNYDTREAWTMIAKIGKRACYLGNHVPCEWQSLLSGNIRCLVQTSHVRNTEGNINNSLLASQHFNLFCPQFVLLTACPRTYFFIASNTLALSH